jgi:hypothetical protein
MFHQRPATRSEERASAKEKAEGRPIGLPSYPEYTLACQPRATSHSGRSQPPLTVLVNQQLLEQ